jgi:hypothetical protein
MLDEISKVGWVHPEKRHGLGHSSLGINSINKKSITGEKRVSKAQGTAPNYKQV